MKRITVVYFYIIIFNCFLFMFIHQPFETYIVLFIGNLLLAQFTSVE